ncbi:MAG: TIGR02281 family clan AA aspartic protease, partial [Planctomycetota bacterium]
RLAEAFRLRPRLLPEETPNAIRLGEVARRLRALVKKIRDRGDPALVADLLYSDMLVELADGRLFLDWIEATAAADGEEHAIQRIDRSSAQIIPLGSDLERELLALLARLFRDAARRAREGGDLGRAWGLVEEGRRRFPDDVELTLLEVELLIDGGEWRPAESLLTRRSYPISHVDRIDRLKARISELKGEEGRIVIEFPPGASTIFTRARLNGSHDQRFLVDTGASLTTIPAATAAALGIRIDEHTPRRQVTTAGGFVMAPEVELASVELGGWVVERVQAFVVDLPGGDRGGLGLLGMNFLSHFRVTLDNERGRLLLDPR